MTDTHLHMTTSMISLARRDDGMRKKSRNRRSQCTPFQRKERPCSEREIGPRMYSILDFRFRNEILNKVRTKCPTARMHNHNERLSIVPPDRLPTPAYLSAKRRGAGRRTHPHHASRGCGHFPFYDREKQVLCGSRHFLRWPWRTSTLLFQPSRCPPEKSCKCRAEHQHEQSETGR